MRICEVVGCDEKATWQRHVGGETGRMAGGKDSVIVVTWRLGDLEVDTGFRADDGDDHRALLDGLMAFVSVDEAQGPYAQGDLGE